MTSGAAPLRGRQAQAAQNDELILRAAREVFLADPTAPISAVAERAARRMSSSFCAACACRPRSGAVPLVMTALVLLEQIILFCYS